MGVGAYVKKRVIIPALLGAVIAGASVRDRGILETAYSKLSNSDPATIQYVLDSNERIGNYEKQIGKILLKEKTLEKLPETRISFKEAKERGLYQNLKKLAVQYIREIGETLHLVKDQEIKLGLNLKEDEVNAIRNRYTEITKLQGELELMEPSDFKRWADLHVAKYTKTRAPLKTRYERGVGGAFAGAGLGVIQGIVESYEKRKRKKEETEEK